MDGGTLIATNGNDFLQNVKKIIAVIDATIAVAKRKTEKNIACTQAKKIQPCTRFEPLTSAIPVQHSNQLS